MGWPSRGGPAQDPAEPNAPPVEPARVGRGDPAFVLASASPRRSRLLAERGLSFLVAPTEADETPSPGLSPEEVAVELAVRKARAAAERSPARDLPIVAADTVVAVGEGLEAALLAKPADAADARRMLSRLSGTRHQVVTGVCVLAPPGEGARQRAAWERTWVTMRPILPEEIEAYVASGEWRGKAGGYAIQETADRFVTALEGGGFDNVVGLPVALTLSLLGLDPSADA